MNARPIDWFRSTCRRLWWTRYRRRDAAAWAVEWAAIEKVSAEFADVLVQGGPYFMLAPGINVSPGDERYVAAAPTHWLVENDVDKARKTLSQVRPCRCGRCGTIEDRSLAWLRRRSEN